METHFAAAEIRDSVCELLRSQAVDEMLCAKSLFATARSMEPETLDLGCNDPLVISIEHVRNTLEKPQSTSELEHDTWSSIENYQLGQEDPPAEVDISSSKADSWRIETDSSPVATDSARAATDSAPAATDSSRAATDSSPVATDSSRAATDGLRIEADNFVPDVETFLANRDQHPWTIISRPAFLDHRF